MGSSKAGAQRLQLLCAGRGEACGPNSLSWQLFSSTKLWHSSKLAYMSSIGKNHSLSTFSFPRWMPRP